MAAQRGHWDRLRLDVYTSVSTFPVLCTIAISSLYAERCRRPGILSSIWGLTNLGRNFGYISYAAFVGTTVFSYLYAFIAAQHVPPGETACKGIQCWQSTFWISVGTAIVACFVSFILWRRWRARV